MGCGASSSNARALQRADAALGASLEQERVRHDLSRHKQRKEPTIDIPSHTDAPPCEQAAVCGRVLDNVRCRYRQCSNCCFLQHGYSCMRHWPDASDRRAPRFCANSTCYLPAQLCAKHQVCHGCCTVLYGTCPLPGAATTDSVASTSAAPGTAASPIQLPRAIGASDGARCQACEDPAAGSCVYVLCDQHCFRYFGYQCSGHWPDGLPAAAPICPHWSCQQEPDATASGAALCAHHCCPSCCFLLYGGVCSVRDAAMTPLPEPSLGPASPPVGARGGRASSGSSGAHVPASSNASSRGSSIGSKPSFFTQTSDRTLVGSGSGSASRHSRLTDQATAALHVCSDASGCLEVLDVPCPHDLCRDHCFHRRGYACTAHHPEAAGIPRPLACERETCTRVRMCSHHVCALCCARNHGDICRLRAADPNDPAIKAAFPRKADAGARGDVCSRQSCTRKLSINPLVVCPNRLCKQHCFDEFGVSCRQHNPTLSVAMPPLVCPSSPCRGPICNHRLCSLHCDDLFGTCGLSAGRAVVPGVMRPPGTTLPPRRRRTRESDA